MINEIIGLAVLGFMLAEWFGPIQTIKDYFKLYNYKLTKWLYCTRCTSFWLGLIVTKSLAIAAIVSILGYTISYLVDLIDRDRYDK
jgi:hypothetical protein